MNRILGITLMMAVTMGCGQVIKPGGIIRKEEEAKKKIVPKYFGHKSDTLGNAAVFRRKGASTDEMIVVFFGPVAFHDKPKEPKPISEEQVEALFARHFDKKICALTRSATAQENVLLKLKDQAKDSDYLAGFPGCSVNKGRFTFVCEDWSYILVSESSDSKLTSVTSLNAPSADVSLRSETFLDDRKKTIAPCRAAQFSLVGAKALLLLEVLDIQGTCATRRQKLQNTSPKFGDFLVPQERLAITAEELIKPNKNRFDSNEVSKIKGTPFIPLALFLDPEPEQLKFFLQTGLLGASSSFRQLENPQPLTRDLFRMNLPRLHLIHPRTPDRNNQKFIQKNVWDATYDPLLMQESEEHLHPQQWMNALSDERLELCEQLFQEIEFINLEDPTSRPSKPKDSKKPEKDKKNP